MTRLQSLALFALLLLLAACRTPAPPLPDPSPTPPPTSSPVPSPTLVPTPAAGPGRELDLGELPIGELTEGEITRPGTATRWQVAGEADHTLHLRVEATRGQLEPFLALYDEAGYLLATGQALHDDEIVLTEPLAEDGTYSVLITPFGESTGRYELQAFLVEEGGGELALGEAEGGEILLGITQHQWGFTVEPGTVVDLTVEGLEEADVSLSLENGDELRIASTYVEAGEGSAELVGVPLLEGGTYYVFLEAYGDLALADYQLALAEGEPQGGGELAYNEVVEGELVAAPHLWLFEGRAGDQVSIETAIGPGEGTDTILLLYGPDGTELAYDDDSGEDYSAVIEEQRLPEDGTYAIMVSFYEPGGYTLALRRQLPGLVGTLTLADPVTGTLAALEDPQLWTLEAEPGAVVEVALVPEGEGDFQLTLYDPSGSVVAFDDDSGGERTPLLRSQPLVMAGEYAVAVTAVGEGGGYTLALRPTQAAGGGTLALGEAREGTLTGPGVPHRWTFTAEEGSEITVTLAALVAPGLDLAVTLYGPDGARLAADDDGGEGLNPRLAGVELSETGEYTLLVEAVTGSGGYELTIAEE